MHDALSRIVSPVSGVVQLLHWCRCSTRRKTPPHTGHHGQGDLQLWYWTSAWLSRAVDLTLCANPFAIAGAPQPASPLVHTPADMNPRSDQEVWQTSWNSQICTPLSAEEKQGCATIAEPHHQLLRQEARRQGDTNGTGSQMLWRSCLTAHRLGIQLIMNLTAGGAAEPAAGGRTAAAAYSGSAGRGCPTTHRWGEDL